MFSPRMARDIEQLRRKVLDASLDLVVEQGVRGVSFREVARRAGVSHQTPYHHFGDHFGILKAIADEGFTALTTAMEGAARSTADPLEALTRAGLAYVDFARGHVGHFRVMFQGGLNEVPPSASAPHALLVQLCTRAHDAGHGSGLSPDTLTHLAWSTVHGLALLELDGLTMARTGGHARELTDGVVRALAGLLSPPPPTKGHSP